MRGGGGGVQRPWSVPADALVHKHALQHRDWRKCAYVYAQNRYEGERGGGEIGTRELELFFMGLPRTNLPPPPPPFCSACIHTNR